MDGYKDAGNESPAAIFRQVAGLKIDVDNIDRKRPSVQLSYLPGNAPAGDEAASNWEVSSNDDDSIGDSVVQSPFDTWVSTRDWRHRETFFFNAVTGESSRDYPDHVSPGTSSDDDDDDNDDGVPNDGVPNDGVPNDGVPNDGFSTSSHSSSSDEDSSVESSGVDECDNDDDADVEGSALVVVTQPESQVPAGSRAMARLHVMEEIIMTEQSYLSSLRVIHDVYAVPFRDRGVDTPVTVLFNNAVHIYTLNCNLLAALEARWGAWRSNPTAPDLTVADLFDEYTPLLLFYTRYSVNLGPAVTILKSYRKEAPEHPMRKLLEECERNPSRRGEPLESLLIKPIQRIPRYILLLQEMRKKTDAGDPDAARITATLTGLQKVADSQNEEVRAREARDALDALQRTLGKKVDIVADGRIIIMQGELTKVDRDGQPVRVYFHLFNDIVMFSRQSPLGGLYKHRFLDMYTLSVEYTNGGYNLSHAFMLKSPKKSFVVYGGTEADTRKWFNAFRAATMALADDSGPGATPAAMRTPASQATACVICETPFTLLSRKHHCRLCGSVTCSACSAHRVLVPSMSTTEKQKVCRDCYEEFGGPTDENDDVGDLPVVAPLMSLVSTFGKSMKRMVQRTSSTGSTNSTSSGGMESPALGKGRNAMMTTFSARRDVAAELLRTESQFHADLEVTLAVMVHPLLSPSLDKDIARTFEALEVIKSLSLKLTRDLDAAVNQDWDDGTTRIGEIFARHASLLNLFADYASNVNAAVKALARSDMRSRVQGVEADPRAAGTRLARRLLVPLQRLSSYTFLLTKLMKMTPPEHCDYGAIADAIAKITSSSKLVTSAMKESGNHAKLQAMEATFKGKVSLDADGREFIRSGKVFLFDPNAVFAKGEAVPRLDAVTVHLFNDRLIVSRGDDKKGYKVDHDLLVDEFADIGFDAEAEAFLAEQGAGSEPPGHYCVMRMRISDTVLGVISKEPNRSWFKDILNVVNATYLKRNAQTDATLEAGSSSA